MSLDPLSLRTQPQWWTAAVYKQVPGRGYVFQKYITPSRVKWPQFLDVQLGYPSVNGYALYPFYWDGRSWMRDPGGAHVSGVEIGRLERTNPLPLGRYWVDILAKQAPAWNAWLAPQLASGAVKIVQVEHFNADPLTSGSWLPVPLQPDNAGVIPDRLWVLFDVVKPAAWDAKTMGFFPTVATADVHTSADTAQNPPGPSPTDEIAEGVSKVFTPIAWVLGLFLGIKIIDTVRK